MTKGVNETVKGSKDPERSAAAKGRKPPPNPWAKVRALEAELQATTETLSRANDDNARALDALQRASDYRQKLSAINGLYQQLDLTQRDIIGEQTAPWWKRNRDRIRHLSRDANSIRERIKQLVANLHVFDPPLNGQLVATDQPGNIAGLAQRGIGSAQNQASDPYLGRK